MFARDFERGPEVDQASNGGTRSGSYQGKNGHSHVSVEAAAAPIASSNQAKNGVDAGEWYF